MSDREPTIRRDLRPGDLGEIIAHHGRLYGREYGVDSTFEGHVASSVAAAGGRGFPRDGEGIWIVERGGAHSGSIALTDDGDGVATVRWFVVDRSLRGRGLGRRLVAEALELARSSGYERVCLETFSELTAAAHIYRGHGFELQSEQTGPRWGREQITYQRYELVLASRQARAQSRSSRSAGASARPFSVSA
jgi:ribosomal protein S18 acetylase RimI-like enzyme